MRYSKLRLFQAAVLVGTIAGFATAANANLVIDAGAIVDGQSFSSKFTTANQPPLFVDFTVPSGQDVNIDLTIKDGVIGASGPISGTFAFYTATGPTTGTIIPGTLVSLGSPSPLPLSKTTTQTADIDAVLGAGTYFAEFIESPVTTTTDPLNGAISITTGVPETSTWAMMLLGFFGVGFMAYRRGKTGSAFRFA